MDVRVRHRIVPSTTHHHPAHHCPEPATMDWEMGIHPSVVCLVFSFHLESQPRGASLGHYESFISHVVLIPRAHAPFCFSFILLWSASLCFFLSSLLNYSTYCHSSCAGSPPNPARIELGWASTIEHHLPGIAFSHLTELHQRARVVQPSPNQTSSRSVAACALVI